MQSKLLLAACSATLLFAGCGGGDYANPYDGTWQAVYPPLSKQSTVSPTVTVLCDIPPATLIIKDALGSATQTATCTTTIITTTTDSAGTTTTTSTTYPPQVTYANISVSIEGRTDINEKDVINAIVNGVTHTGTCISTVACSAVSAAGDTLGLTR